MLRSVVLGIAILLSLSGPLSQFLDLKNAWPMTIWGLILLIAILFEKWRYKKPNNTDLSQWQKTDEQFIDPETGKLTQVFYQPETGDRRYEILVDKTSSEDLKEKSDR